MHPLPRGAFGAVFFDMRTIFSGASLIKHQVTLLCDFYCLKRII